VEQVLQKLGVPRPAPDLEGLRAVYAAWCLAVPFDNVRKMIALRTPGAILPGIPAEDFFERWLADGTGGTCWPGSNALHDLLRALGFETRRLAASMRDTGVLSHGSAVVRLEGQDWVVDSSMLTNEPLPLADGVFLGRDPLIGAEVERDPDGSYLVWTHFPPGPEPIPCRLLVDPAPAELYAARYEASRQQSPFNHRLHARRNRPGELLVIIGSTRYSKTADGLAARELSRQELLAALREEIGLSAAAVNAWVASGSLEESLQPPSGPKPPAATRKPPTQR